ncbi:lysine-specific demethylase JMJ31 isoform X1 [Hevea brasiliensis]|uniref:lysine-specific demethylase JMJ31 isoform X1 n=1 Tax=Hevea brasiliensis TaxID=3981 RepID=UPI0025F20E3C|nr:lysine-specific demethylase JMJ31 isoform X1 [Hevea brasiliensis]
MQRQYRYEKSMEDTKQLQIESFQQLPSPSLFASQIESKNVPAVFRGCIKEWKAFTRWNPVNGGLNYLQELVGSSTVEAMLSRSAPVFYGDLRSHERVPIPFSTFIGLCKQLMSNAERHEPAVSDAQEQDPLLSGDAPQKIYLAQVPIMNTEDQERVQLGVLREDIQTPAFLETKELASINLWMNSALSRSSTHYDPHHNVLCIVAGCKQVVLWPPSASPSLYPKPIYGEASNHSSVALENPDFSLYPRAECSIEYSQKVILHAGDALFIPEGWFHQVDSSNLTIAVNFWWRSNIMSSMLEHMDAYYLRRILRRLTDKEMNHILQKASSPSMEKQKMPTCKLPSNGEADHSHCDLVQPCEKSDLQGTDQQQRVNLHLLEPYALQVLHDLVSLVHDRVNLIDQSHLVESTSANDSAVSMKGQYDKTATTNVFILEDDPVAKILWTLDPHTLQNVLLSMAHNFPRTLEALILHLLSPVGAEVLTQKFDEMDQLTTEENRNKFYEVFYEAFDDQFAAMDAILNGKELFALQLDKNLPSMPIDRILTGRFRIHLK